MVFNSMVFLVFFVAVTGLHFAIPDRRRWLLLLVASYFFYMWAQPAYALLILFTTSVNYYTAIRISESDSARHRKHLLLLSLVASLGVLFFFKYFNFAVESITAIIGMPEIERDRFLLDIVLPIGISFFTFQTLSYTVDVYRGQMPPERHFGRFALYVSFFPQLVAGPIERGTHLMPQFRQKHSFDLQRVIEGLQLMGWGLFKKIVVADRLAMYVQAVYGNVDNHDGPSFLVATYFFAFQIYCDFSGYSDMAIGGAKVLGYDLIENFRRPYFATTITDFWRRWHISLSTWLRDYLYIPLGGNRCSKTRAYINLMITMLLGGLWHGASWNFVIWGGLQGVMLCISKATLPVRDAMVASLKIPRWIVKPVRILVTFHLVCLSWVFFRAATIHDAWQILIGLFDGWPNLFIKAQVMAYGAMGIFILLIAQLIQRRGTIIPRLKRSPLAVQWAVAYALIMLIILCGVDQGAQFIYFQF
jgi:D-alanyl-lipoteichoic acid acyltransferase DltB (MBOAT superfamily)